jgi:energy-converting hydrogenase Eha subunit A
MKLEQVPIVIGVLVCLIAAAIAYDAIRGDTARPFRERRRRQRAEINTPGEWLVALGTACIGASLIGREDWRWGTIAVIAGATFLLLGAILNRAFLKEILLFRGAARRTAEAEVPPVAKIENEPRLRIR